AGGRGAGAAAVVEDCAGPDTESAQAIQGPGRAPLDEEVLVFPGYRDALGQGLVVVVGEAVEVNGRLGRRVRHFRRNPRILMKKNDTIVWNPSAVSVTPGTTQRMV